MFDGPGFLSTVGSDWVRTQVPGAAAPQSIAPGHGI